MLFAELCSREGKRHAAETSEGSRLYDAGDALIANLLVLVLAALGLCFPGAASPPDSQLV
jgi:hypothetical protein